MGPSAVDHGYSCSEFLPDGEFQPTGGTGGAGQNGFLFGLGKGGSGGVGGTVGGTFVAPSDFLEAGYTTDPIYFSTVTGTSGTTATKNNTGAGTGYAAGGGGAKGQLFTTEYSGGGGGATALCILAYNVAAGTPCSLYFACLFFNHQRQWDDRGDQCDSYDGLHSCHSSRRRRRRAGDLPCQRWKGG